MFTKKTIRDIDLKDTRVLLRADYNVPLEADGTITADYRITQSVPTIKALLAQGVRLVICSHLGRPDGRPDRALSLRPVAKRLSELLEQDVQFADDCIGEEAKEAVDALQPGQVLLLENLRFHPEEEQNDDNWQRTPTSLCRMALVSSTVHMPAQRPLRTTCQVWLVCCSKKRWTPSQM